MEAEIISSAASYGVWGITSLLLIINWFVIKKLFETIDTHNKILNETIANSSKNDAELVNQLEAMVVELRRRPCLKDREER